MSSVHSAKYKSLIDKLILARKEAGFTQNEVAERLQKPQSYISKVENRQRRVDAIELKELADLYKVDAMELLNELSE